MDTKARSVVVTGAGSDGCGRAIARRFARAGAGVIADDLDEAGTAATVGLIAADGGHARSSSTDVRSERAVDGLIAFAERTFGPLAVIVNNASPEYHPGEPLAHWRETIETDLLGAAFVTTAAIQAMRRHRLGGAIVNMSSISALPFGGDLAADVPAYDAAKAGVMRLTTGLASLAGSDGIRVNALAPGWIASRGPRTYWESLTPDERKTQGVPSRLLTLEEVADMVFRLATDERLYGRVIVWQSEDIPRIIPFADAGYSQLLPLEP